MNDTSLNKFRFQSRIIRTDVTAIKIIFNFVFAGIGNVLHVFSISNKTCQYFPVLIDQRIHGIIFNSDSNLVAIYGNREIAVALLSINRGNVCFTRVSRWVVGDWIWDVKWSKNPEELILLTANNIVSMWQWKVKRRLNMVKCGDKCLLYCGIIFGSEWDDCVVICGTMFRSILIWTPSHSCSDTCSVLQKLPGHKGAIFSVFYHEKSQRICSTSDDRSVKIWNVKFSSESSSIAEAWRNAQITLLFSVFGHMSRVWKSFVLDDAKFISAGEDSQLRMWRQNGEPIYSWETHQGASIRSLDVCEKLDVIVTGSKDGGISLWPLHRIYENLEIAFSDKLKLKNIRDVPRRLLLTKSGNILTTTNDGMLLSYSDETWYCVSNDARFSSYCLFDTSPCRTLISLASIKGYIKILIECDDISFMKTIYDNRLCVDKIFSLHWLSEYSFITCCADGKLEIWNLNCSNGNYSVVKIGDHVLPPCKERWLTSAVVLHNGIIVGDREGTVHVFRNCVLLPCQTFRRIHGRLGVSSISYDGNCELYSIGRDGFIRYWNIKGMVIEHLAADKLPVTWPVRIISSQSHGLLVLGFNETNFELWNVKERKRLFTHKCGGGHRPWDFIFGQFSHFVYIRDKFICNVKVPLDQLVKPSYLEGFHIRDVLCARFLDENYVISAGEDTTIRLSKLNSKSQIFEPRFIIRSHISSVRAISFIRVDDFIIVVSVGGRAQMKVWKLIISGDDVKYSEFSSHMLKSSSKCRKPWMNMIPTCELEPRYMDVQIERISDSNYLIYTAGSDAVWRIFDFNLTNRTLELLNEIEYFSYCILKLSLIRLKQKKLIVTLATDGQVTFWDSNDRTISSQQRLHQSGINSFDYTLVDNLLMLATGGDDTCLSVSMFDYDDEKVETIAQWKNSTVHEAQISGIRIVKRFIISTGADQKIVLWEWNVQSTVIIVDLKSIHHSFIPDIHGLDIAPSEETICVYGAGVEILSFS